MDHVLGLNKTRLSSDKQPFFRFEDLTCADIKEDNYVDPYYRIRRPIEPERLKVIYQQAFIYDLLYNFAKEHLPDIPNAKIKSERDKDDAFKSSNNKATDTTVDNIKDLILDYLFKNQIEIDRNNFKYPKNASESNETECIWNTDDITILRKSFSEIKENNIRLRSQILLHEEENRELKEKLERSNADAKNFEAEKFSLEQQNERLYIRVQDLESRYDSFSRDFQNLNEDKNELVVKLSKFKKTHDELTKEKTWLELELQKCEAKLASIGTELKLNYSNAAEKLKIECLHEINRYKKKLQEEKEQFESLKSQHEKSQKALEHLRTHFMHNLIPQKTGDRIDDKKIKII